MPSLFADSCVDNAGGKIAFLFWAMLFMECWQEYKNKSGSFKSMPHINIKWKTHDTLTSMREVYSLHDTYFFNK